MVVWLKPCKSRSSPGALSGRLPNRGGVRFCAQRDLQQVIARGFYQGGLPSRRGPRFCEGLCFCGVSDKLAARAASVDRMNLHATMPCDAEGYRPAFYDTCHEISGRVACLWFHWTRAGKKDRLSFAITRCPPRRKFRTLATSAALRPSSRSTSTPD